MGRPTHRRLVLLLVVAAVSGIVAGVSGKASAGKSAAAPPAAAAPVPYDEHIAARACPLPRSLRPAFVAASRDTGLPIAMLVAVAKVESNLSQDARSGAGARGLLQLMPATAASMNLNPDEPQGNVLAGARYLRMMMSRFGSTDLALAAYNAGPTAVDIAGGAPSSGVVTYVANVTTLWRSLAGCR